MNQVILIGRLCAEPELRYTANQTPVCSYRLAVERDYKKENQPDADFINCICWRNTAEFASKYLHKGMKIAITGKLQTSSYEDKDGKKVYTTDVIVERHEFCESRKTEGNHITKNSAEYEDAYVEMADDEGGELPF